LEKFCVRKQMGLNKFNNLKIKPGAESSRFVIDLKQELAAAETKGITSQQNLSLELKLEKLAELDYGQILKQGRENTKKNFTAFIDYAKELGAGMTKNKRPKNNQPGAWLMPNSPVGKIWLKLDRLAFVVLIKLVYIILKQAVILICQACYWVGWVIIFSLRLVYFLLLETMRPLARAMNFLVSRFRPIIIKGLKIFSGVFQMMRSVIAGILLKRIIVRDRDCFVPRVKPGAKGAPRNDKRVVGYLRPVLVFAGVLLIMILPVKAWTFYKTLDSARGKVLGASESAMNNLISGGLNAANLDFNGAGKSFAEASSNFLIAENQLKEINGLLFTLAAAVPDKNLRLAAASKHLVRAGELSAAAGKDLSLAIAALFNYQASSSKGILLNLTVYGHRAIVDLTALGQELDQINSEVLPEDYQTKFILLKQKIGQLSRWLSEFIGLADQLESFLGGGAAKRYLLVFQNNSELRASGGFIGSFALIDVLNGRIKKIEAPGGGSYDTDAGLLKKIKSPEPLRLIRPDWHFWDANWWPDWPTSARKLAWFYANSDGSTVDGVIGLTPTVMEEILRIIGPIDMKDKYGVIIDADNFWRVTQEFAEQKPNVTKEPKKIIGDLMNKIIAELPERLNKDNLLPLLKAIEGLLTDKNILFYFTDNKLQAEVRRLGWIGEIKTTAGDYLSVINTNIAGGKSDRRIRQEIIHRAEVQPDGTIIDNLTIRRTHEGIKREPFSGVRNVDWLRIYVPLGSELIEASGFKPVDKIFFKEAEADWQNDPDLARGEALALTDDLSGTKIYNELDKTVFANWSQVDPGQTIAINIKYQLPFKLIDKKPSLAQSSLDNLLAKANAMINPDQKELYSYSLLAQKQPGMNSSTFQSELKLSDNFKIIWQYPTGLTVNLDGWFRKEIFDQDKLMAVMVEEK